MASKDDAELGMMKRAAAITLEIYSKVFKENLKDVINADRVCVWLITYLKFDKMVNCSPVLVCTFVVSTFKARFIFWHFMVTDASF